MTVQLPPAVLINADPELLQQIATPARLAQWQPGEVLAAIITRIDNRQLILQTAGGLLRLPLPARKSGEPPPALSPKQAVLLSVIATDPLLRLRIEARPPGAPAIPAALQSQPPVPALAPAPVHVTRLAPPRSGAAPASSDTEAHTRATRQLAQTLRRALPLLIRPAPASPQWFGRLADLAASAPAVPLPHTQDTDRPGTVAMPTPGQTSIPGKLAAGSSAQPATLRELAAAANQAAPATGKAAAGSDAARAQQTPAAAPAGRRAMKPAPDALATATSSLRKSFSAPPPESSLTASMPASMTNAGTANTRPSVPPAMLPAAKTAPAIQAPVIQAPEIQEPAKQELLPASPPSAAQRSAGPQTAGASFVGAAPVEWPVASADWLPRLLQQLASQWPQASELGDADLELLLRGLLFGKAAQASEQAGESPALRQWLQHGHTLLLRLAAAAPHQLLPRAANAAATGSDAATAGAALTSTTHASTTSTSAASASTASTSTTATGTTATRTTGGSSTAVPLAGASASGGIRGTDGPERRERGETDSDGLARAGDNSPAKLLEELVQLLSRAQAQPLQNLRSDLQPQNLLYATLPLRDGDRIDDIEISIREDETTAAEAGRARQHVVRLRFDLPGLGACQFILDMRGDDLDMRFYAERDATTQLFDTHVEQLVRELAGENIAVTHVESHCLQQLPSLKPQPASGVDTHV